MRKTWIIAIGGSGMLAVATLYWQMGNQDESQPAAPAIAATTAATITASDTPPASALDNSCQTITAPTSAKAGMQWIDGASFAMGSDAAYREEAPVRTVTLDGFWIDTFEVTNLQFKAFVDATDYITVAERVPDPALIPGAPPDMLKPGSVMFRQPEALISRNMMQWWIYKPGADWRHPEGPGTTIEGKMDYPVVHIAFEDAQTYAAWAGRSLPTEAQWELAARSKSDGTTYAWGDARVPEGKHQANTWQGIFPLQNTQDDGHIGASPVGCFPGNAYGLFDMIGNVWEWTADYYASGHNAAQTLNPQGPTAQASFDPSQSQFPVRVIKGGSFLCAPNYCMRYRPSARQAQDTGLGSDHIGFRTVLN
jgi:sulfatase modifying factor 1